MCTTSGREFVAFVAMRFAWLTDLNLSSCSHQLFQPPTIFPCSAPNLWSQQGLAGDYIPSPPPIFLSQPSIPGASEASPETTALLGPQSFLLGPQSLEPAGPRQRLNSFSAPNLSLSASNLWSQRGLAGD